MQRLVLRKLHDRDYDYDDATKGPWGTWMDADDPKAPPYVKVAVAMLDAAVVSDALEAGELCRSVSIDNVGERIVFSRLQEICYYIEEEWIGRHEGQDDGT